MRFGNVRERLLVSKQAAQNFDGEQCHLLGELTVILSAIWVAVLCTGRPPIDVMIPDAV